MALDLTGKELLTEKNSKEFWMCSGELWERSLVLRLSQKVHNAQQVRPGFQRRAPLAALDRLNLPMVSLH